VKVARAVSADGRYVCKSIVTPDGRKFSERVRLFEPGQIAAMLGATGIVVRHRFGDYDAAPLRPGSPRTILAGSVA
jgi:hypothetical protein